MTEVDSHVDMPTQADAVEQAQPDVVAQATELFSDTAKWIFEAYDQDHDGLMTRKEFFTFLWELKKDQPLTEGQMMSCWKVVDAKEQNSIDYEEFVQGVEICYERLFFAAENGVRPPEPVHIPASMYAPEASQRGLITEEVDKAAYNTVKFKQSAGVQLFENILAEEDAARQLREQEEEEKRKAILAWAHTPSSRRASERSTESADAASPHTDDASSGYTPRASSGSAAAGTSAQGRPLTSAAILAKQQQEREARRQESQATMAKILAEKHKADMARREADRLAKAEAEKEKLSREVYEVEPAWKVALRQKAGAYGK